MTGKKRNGLTALFILVFPFLVFLAFLIYELNRAPSSGRPLPGSHRRNNSTNAVSPASPTGTNLNTPGRMGSRRHEEVEGARNVLRLVTSAAAARQRYPR